MPTNSEMYERGALDAERDDLNPFYYQHYFYYRKGYDETRRSLRRAPAAELVRRSGLFAALFLMLAVGGLGGWWIFGRAPIIAVGNSLPSATAPASLIPATRTPRPSPTPPPTITPTTVPTLAIGARARIVNLNGAPLRIRADPGLTQLVGRIPEGSEVTLLDGPVDADGYTWWLIEAEDGTGWSAAGSPEGVNWLEPLP